MKKVSGMLLILCIVIAGFFSVQNVLESAESKKISLLGKWQVTHIEDISFHPKTGVTTTVNGVNLLFEIYKQEGNFLFARMHLTFAQNNKAIHDIGGKEIRSEVEERIGMLKHDGKNVIFLCTTDNGRLDMEIIDENTISVYYTEQGHDEAVIAYSTFKRVK
ncbi:MAG: hypothetical protein GY710_15780 [Desulfobacteraceae bacterium]|nr:hypothetical protein [Desulfobacteraceae bacterium]